VILEGIGSHTRDSKISNRDGDGHFNDALLVVVLEVCFPSFASEFSSSYGWVASPSQSLDSATLFTDGFHFSGWVYGTPLF